MKAILIQKKVIKQSKLSAPLAEELIRLLSEVATYMLHEKTIVIRFYIYYCSTNRRDSYEISFTTQAILDWCDYVNERRERIKYEKITSSYRRFIWNNCHPG